MGMAQARLNSYLTNSAYKLVKAERVALIPSTGNYEVVGACGHRLTVVRPRDAAFWEEKVQAGKVRRRCDSCVKEPEAAQARLLSESIATL